MPFTMPCWSHCKKYTAGTAFFLLLFFFAGGVAGAAPQADDALARTVDGIIRPLMARHAIPGMVAGVTVRGQRHVFVYGVAEKTTGRQVSAETLFEIGSLSKPLTALLGVYAEAKGTLTLADTVSTHLPALKGSAFDTIRLLDLATYTAGGLPLQFPASVTTHDTMIAYYRNWQPLFSPGTQRLYSNPSIGLFGFLAAQSLGRPFTELMETTLLPALGLTHTYYTLPREEAPRYAQGYAADNTPARLAPGVLDAEAYGIKTTVTDMLRFAEANAGGTVLDPLLREAVKATHRGYATTGPMTQCLGWERYSYPTPLADLLAGNASRVVLEPNPVTPHSPPRAPSETPILLNKTGSTRGFGAYMLLVPDKGIGIVLLANKNYPTPGRIQAAHAILSFLDGSTP